MIKEEQTLIFHKFVRDYTKLDGKNIAVDIPEFTPFIVNRKDCINIRSVKTLSLFDYNRTVLLVKTDTYPLIWILWVTLLQVETINYRLQGIVYYFLKNKLNKGVDFVPSGQYIGHWQSMLSHFIRYKNGIR
jgi:hypothetical protein